MEEMKASQILGEIKKSVRMLKAFKAAEEVVTFMAGKESYIKQLDRETKDAKVDATAAKGILDRTKLAIKEAKDEHVKISMHSKKAVEDAGSRAAVIIKEAEAVRVEIKAEAILEKNKIKADIEALSINKQDLSAACVVLNQEKESIEKYITSQKKKISGVFN